MMMTTVTDSLSVFFYLKLQGNSGLEMDIPFLLDTGFSEALSLPLSWLDALQFPVDSSDQITLADGISVSVNVHRGRVTWDGQIKEVAIHCLEGDPLLGMSLMLDYLLTLPVQENAVVTLAPI